MSTTYTLVPFAHNTVISHTDDGYTKTASIPCSIAVRQVPGRGRTLVLSRPLEASLHRESDGDWRCHEPHLSIDGYGLTYWEAIQDFHREFLWLWDEIANRDSSKLDLVAQELKEKMKAIVKERKVIRFGSSAYCESYRHTKPTQAKGVYTEIWKTRPRDLPIAG